MNTNNHTPTNPPSVLASLRGLVPDRRTSFTEALRVAETQAARLRFLTDTDSLEFPEDAITDLPRIRVRRRTLPMSGMSYWNGQEWVIALNNREPEARQRFTLLHEYKHILDHGRATQLYLGTARHDSATQAEQAADYFAGCALMPKALVKRLWGQGIQRPDQLAQQFGVSERAIEVRLAQLGLTEPTPRCQHQPLRRQTRPKRYYRNNSSRLEVVA